MTKHALLNSQVKRLLSSLSAHCTQHLTETETDLVQTNVLLAEAIDKLSGSFMCIHEAVSAQQQLVEALLAGAAPTAEISDQLKAKYEEIGTHVNAAVTGLQFQDMTNQLISRAIRRINGLRYVMGSVASSSTCVSTEDDIEQLRDELDALQKALETQSRQLDSELWKAVRQTHMESGDIELF